MNDKIDDILENSLRESLLKKPHMDFAKNLMLKISLEEEFALQDKKTEKFAKKIIFGISGVFAAVTAFIIYMIYSNPESSENSGVIAEKTSSFFEQFGLKALNLLGLNGGSSIFLILSVIIIATIFLTVDKLILKKK
ncbi:MAG: hypothetical protein JSS63_07565 [Bacteroidetes bacterium]|nr:hypothetical protein [Bacteroidota bacterium]MBX7044877.1 hypothetical protein [Ignavibacteria bacterium]